jgi:hypothetical protein
MDACIYMKGMHDEIISWHVSLFAYMCFIKSTSQIYHDFGFQIFDDIL